MMSMFHILIGMVATRYTFVKTHQTVLLKSVHSTACKLYFSKVDKRNEEKRKENEKFLLGKKTPQNQMTNEKLGEYLQLVSQIRDILLNKDLLEKISNSKKKPKQQQQQQKKKITDRYH